MTSLYKYLLISSLLVIFVFALSPSQFTPAYVVNHDKAAHVMAFFILSLLLRRAFPVLTTPTHVMILGLLALMIEMVQYLLVGRGFSVEDLLYGLMGIFLFVAISKCSKLLLEVFYK